MKTKPTSNQRIARFLAFFLCVASAATMSYGEQAVKPKPFGRIAIAESIAGLPEKSENVLEEVRLIDNGTTGVRVFRVYKPVPRHHHKFADSYLQILSGKAEVSIDGAKPIIASAGEMVFWRAGIDHEVVRILEEPLVFLAFDSPVRRKGDVTFFQKQKSEPKKW